MLTGAWLYVVAVLASFGIASIASPVGVSAAVLLLPFQVTVLGTPSPAVTPTNLLYDVVATPGALYRYWRRGQTGGAVTRLLLAGTLPGVVAGSVIRVEVLPRARVFDGVIAVVLVPLGMWLVARRARVARAVGLSSQSSPQLRPPSAVWAAFTVSAARLQPYFPETAVRRPLGVLVLAIGAGTPGGDLTLGF